MIDQSIYNGKVFKIDTWEEYNKYFSLDDNENDLNIICFDKAKDLDKYIVEIHYAPILNFKDLDSNQTTSLYYFDKSKNKLIFINIPHYYYRDRVPIINLNEYILIKTSILDENDKKIYHYKNGKKYEGIIINKEEKRNVVIFGKSKY